MTIAELIAKIAFKADTKPLDAINQKLESLKHAITALVAFEAVKSIFELTAHMAEFGDELNAAAYAAGLTAEQLQKLQYSAGQSGAHAEDVAQGMARMTRTLYEARKGGKEAQAAFAAVGINGSQLASFKDGSEALHAISDRFIQIKDPIKKAALATQLFGRGNVQMVKWLSEGGKSMDDAGKEAARLGAIVRNDQINALEKLSDTLATLHQVIKAFTASMAAALAPAIRTVIKLWLDFYAANRQVISSGIERWAKTVAYAMGYLAGLVMDVATFFGHLVQRNIDLFHWVGKVAKSVVDFAMSFAPVRVAVDLLTGAVGGLGKGFSWFYDNAIAPWLPMALTVIASIAGWIFIFGKVKDAIRIAAGMLSVLGDMASWAFSKMLLPMLNAARMAIGSVIARLGILIVETFPALGATLFEFGAAMTGTWAAALGPIALVIGAIIAIGVAVHDLWAIFHDHKDFKDTWIGQMFGGLMKGVKLVGGALGFGGHNESDDLSAPGAKPMIPEKFGDELDYQQLAKNPGALMGIGGANAQSLLQQYAASQGSRGALGGAQNPGLMEPQTLNVPPQTVTVNAPLTVNVPAGTDPKEVHKSVATTVKEHMGSIMRQAARSTRPARAY